MTLLVTLLFYFMIGTVAAMFSVASLKPTDKVSIVWNLLVPTIAWPILLAHKISQHYV